MQGLTLCAKCGLERSSGGTNRIRLRTALLGMLSSGFLAKMLIGAVAVAAMGGVAVSGLRQAAEPPTGATATTQTFLQTEASLLDLDLVESVRAGDAFVERVHEYVEAVEQWGDCVSVAARDHSGGPFDPEAACGETPMAAEHGLKTSPLPGKAADAPGQQPDPPGKAADAPGQQPDPPGKAADAPGQQPDPPGKAADAPGKGNE
jgi:hypothetical protein